MAIMTALSAMFLSLGMSQEAVLIFGTLMMIDFVTGVAAAYTLDRDSVTSNTAMRGIIKKVSIFLIPFVVAMVGRGAGYQEMTGMVTMVTSLLITTEGYSIIGNIYCIQYKKCLPEIDAVELLLRKIGAILKTLVEGS